MRRTLGRRDDVDGDRESSGGEREDGDKASGLHDFRRRGRGREANVQGEASSVEMWSSRAN